jgi:hypothetical protein
VEWTIEWIIGAIEEGGLLGLAGVVVGVAIGWN